MSDEKIEYHPLPEGPPYYDIGDEEGNALRFRRVRGEVYSTEEVQARIIHPSGREATFPVPANTRTRFGFYLPDMPYLPVAVRTVRHPILLARPMVADTGPVLPTLDELRLALRPFKRDNIRLEEIGARWSFNRVDWWDFVNSDQDYRHYWQYLDAHDEQVRLWGLPVVQREADDLRGLIFIEWERR